MKNNGLSEITERDSQGRIIASMHLAVPSLITIVGDGTAHVQLFGMGGERAAVIDEADLQLVSQHRWYCAGSLKKNTLYARSSTGGRMHRLLLGETGSNKVDHRDGDGLNNRRYNLRSTSQSGNARNATKRRGGSFSRYKGVTKAKLRFRARICVSGHRNGLRVHIGSFRTEEDAARAYDDAARQHFGQFAAVNFPREGERCCLNR